ncbi:hypothetical protein KVR01_010521 [Diaporthe batatas]|uniref:uncharacterized protein n=1 Tax=Diaporthe batatas TaxID=748121 RepID=UPI001D0483D9|nr:uncharacterized protein KVR01_010521 [Diaporthe batatas]KAG8159884.1 hypothetical protein KVR01_010521 [Diaporthe batatas]
MSQASTSASVEGGPDDAVVRLDAVPALIEWTGPDDQVIRLGDSLSASPVSLDLEFNPTAKTTFLRLRIGAQVHRDSNKQTPLYLHIGPDDINTLACPDSIQDQTNQDQPTSAHTSFDVRLRRPVALIGPPFRLRPSNKARVNVINHARALAARRDFSIRIQDGLLSESQYKAICTAVYHEYSSTGRLDLASLYGGLGGKQLVARDPDGTSTPDDGIEAPPSYDEVEGPPPMAPLFHASDPGPSSKKRRLSSPAADPTASLLAVEDICRKLMAEQQAKTEQSLRALEDRLTAHLDSRYERLREEDEQARDKLSAELNSRFGELRTQVDGLKQQVGEHNGIMAEELEKLSEEIQVVSDDIESRVDLRVEDAAAGFRLELEDFIRDELRDVEAAVRGSLRRANVSIEFED